MCLVLWCVAASAGAQTLGAMSGVVADQTTAPLSGVRVAIHGAAIPHRGNRRGRRIRL